MTRRNRSNSGPIGTIRVSSTPFCSPSVTRPRLWIASASVLSCSRPSRSRVELILDLPEIVAEPADVPGPAVNRSLGRTRFEADQAIEPSGDALQPLLGVGGQGLSIRAAEKFLQSLGDVDEPSLVDDQLAGQVHQVIEPIALDPDRLGDLGLARLASGLGGQRRPAPSRHVR